MLQTPEAECPNTLMERVALLRAVYGVYDICVQEPLVCRRNREGSPLRPHGWKGTPSATGKGASCFWTGGER